jgi:hypothetical protein
MASTTKVPKAPLWFVIGPSDDRDARVDQFEEWCHRESDAPPIRSVEPLDDQHRPFGYLTSSWNFPSAPLIRLAPVNPGSPRSRKESSSSQHCFFRRTRLTSLTAA